VVVFAAGVATFDDLVYGGPLASGYRAGEITFSLAAILPDARLMPVHLIGPGRCWSPAWPRWD
jgi:hypothetical protein